MTTAVTTEPKPQTARTDTEISPEFIVNLFQTPGTDHGVVKITAQRSFRSRRDINRWLASCVAELALELNRMDGSDDELA